MGDLADALGESGGEPTDTQQEVLDVAERNPDMKQTEIADVVGCSDSTVSRTFKEYSDPHGNRGTDSTESSGGGALKWFLLILLVLGAIALLSEGESGGAESALTLLSLS